MLLFVFFAVVFAVVGRMTMLQRNVTMNNFLTMIMFLINNNIGEVFHEELFGTFKLLLSVFFHLFKLIFPAHNFPLVYTEAVIGEYLYALYLLVLAKGFTQSSDILFHITISRYEYIAEPEGVVVLFEPCSGTQGLLVATAGKLAMALGVELLDVEQYEVYFAEEFFYMLVPHTTV